MGVYRVYPTIPAYTTYIGKPLYKLSKKHLGDSQFLALNLADAPASLAFGGAYYAATSSVFGALLASTIHQLATTLALSLVHQKNTTEKRDKRRALESLIDEIKALPDPQTDVINK